MSRGVAAYSLVCLIFWSVVGIIAAFEQLAKGEIMSALFAPLIVLLLYLASFYGGVMALNVLGVVGSVLDVNVKESRRIRGKE